MQFAYGNQDGKMSQDEDIISIVKSEHYQYPFPDDMFRPDEVYPEYPFSQQDISIQDNNVYAAVRESLFLLGLDKEHFGTKEWNPFGAYIKPGSKVVIKPNLVKG